MIDFDSIWRIQDEIRTVVNAVLGALDLGRLLPAGRKNASGISHTMKNAVPSFLNCLLPLKKTPSVIYAASSCLASVPTGRAPDTCRLRWGRIEGNEIRVLLIIEKGTPSLRFPGVLFRGI